ncbi:MAG: M17 family peptidase N-terminal domain-containing protein, partial [Stellaceae bacterium]
MKISFAAPRTPHQGTLALPVAEERKLLPTAARLDADSGGALSRAMAASRFKGKGEETLSVLAPARLELGRVLLYGIGKEGGGGGERSAWQNRGGQILAQLNAAGEKLAAVVLDHAAADEGEAAVALAYGARLRSYRFDKYRTKEKPERKPSLE